MAGPAVPTEKLVSAQRKRIFVKLGTYPVKVKKAGGGYETVQRVSFMKCRQNTADDLNFPIATADEVKRLVDGREVYAQGAKHGRKVIIPDPLGAKTAKGGIRTYSVMFPTGMKVSQIAAFFKATKVESFSIKGGGTYGVTK
jgi:hypothetical protein